MRRSPSERSGKGCCGQWFAGPPLRAVIAVVALGGVACALGGAALGATGLAGPPTSHLTAALLMIGEFTSRIFIQLLFLLIYTKPSFPKFSQTIMYFFRLCFVFFCRQPIANQSIELIIYSIKFIVLFWAELNGNKK